MATEGLVEEPPAVAAGGGEGGGDGGARSKQRPWDKVYARRSKKAKTISSSGEGSTDGHGVLGGAPPTFMGSAGAELSKEMAATVVVADGGGQKAAKGGTVLALSTHNVNSDLEVTLQRHTATANCVESTNADCPQLETHATSSQELLNKTGKHSIAKLLSKDSLRFLKRSKQLSRALKGKIQNNLEAVWGIMRGVGLESQAFPLNFPIDVNTRKDVAGPLQLRPNVVSLTPSILAQRTQSVRPLNQHSVAMMGHSFCLPDSTRKGTPISNQFYRNSEFILANDKFPPSDSNKKLANNKFPPSESNKKSKSNVKKSNRHVLEFRVGSKTFKICSALLKRLLKHKFGYIFDSPVDVKGLGLHDYFMIIKQPMDLGTVRDRLNSNYYKVPREFAEDVRLTFYNAMTYNPEGHDVHTVAKALLKIFDERWDAIETEYRRALKFAHYNDVRAPASARSTPPAPSLLSSFRGRFLSRSQSIANPLENRSETMDLTPSGGIRAPKKPKAKDPDKRDMTYTEKQKLSSGIQSLPLEKLDGMIQIIKRRNPLLSQQGNDIELDIDAVDNETLWELDRFITNQRKSMSKLKRKNKHTAQSGKEANAIVPQNITATESTGVEANGGGVLDGARGETRTDGNIVSSSIVAPPPSVADTYKSSSSRSSSTDTGSSSSSGSDIASSPEDSGAKQSPAS